MEIRDNGRPYSPWPIERPEDKETKDTEKNPKNILLEQIKDSFEKSPLSQENKKIQELIKNNPKI